MTITDHAFGRPGRCLVCGGRACLCGAEVRGFDLAPALAKSSGPPRNYSFARGAHPSATDNAVFRLTMVEAIFYGVEPDPKGALVPFVKRRLTFAGIDAAVFAKAFARITLDEQRAVLQKLAATDNAELAEKAAEANDELANVVALLGPEVDPDASLGDAHDAPPTDARVGEVINWVEAGAEVERFDRARRALAAERAGKNRPTLTAVLERVLEEE